MTNTSIHQQHQQSLVNKIPEMLLHGAGSGAIKSVIVYDMTTRILPAVIGGLIKKSPWPKQESILPFFTKL